MRLNFTIFWCLVVKPFCGCSLEYYSKLTAPRWGVVKGSAWAVILIMHDICIISSNLWSMSPIFHCPAHKSARVAPPPRWRQIYSSLVAETLKNTPFFGSPPIRTKGCRTPLTFRLYYRDICPLHLEIRARTGQVSYVCPTARFCCSLEPNRKY